PTHLSVALRRTPSGVSAVLGPRPHLDLLKASPSLAAELGPRRHPVDSPSGSLVGPGEADNRRRSLQQSSRVRESRPASRPRYQMLSVFALPSASQQARPLLLVLDSDPTLESRKRATQVQTTSRHALANRAV